MALYGKPGDVAQAGMRMRNRLGVPHPAPPYQGSAPLPPMPGSGQPPPAVGSGPLPMPPAGMAPGPAPPMPLWRPTASPGYSPILGGPVGEEAPPKFGGTPISDPIGFGHQGQGGFPQQQPFSAAQQQMLAAFLAGRARRSGL